MNNLENENAKIFDSDFWQAEVLGEIYETNFAELTEWIAEGAILPSDKVRRGNLRWLEAGKVPSLIPFFNAKEQGAEPPVVQTTIVNTEASGETLQVPPENIQIQQQFSQAEPFGNQNGSRQTPHNDHCPPPAGNFCVMHAEEEAKYICQTCMNTFCRHCPKAYGGSVKICPMCGAMCKTIAETQAKQQKEAQYSRAMTEGFGFSDFGRALAHPFKFKASLFFGGIMFSFFTFGQSAAAIGGFFMVGAAIMCFMLANMLTFGVLANTIDNFSQGKLEANFMPGFDDFSLWDDVVHPFFLSIGAYISSFGPLILTLVIAAYMVISSLFAQANSMPEEIARNTYPQQHDSQKVSAQTEEVKRLLEQIRQNEAKNDSFKNSNLNFEEQSPFFDDTEEQVMQAQELIERTRRQQFESVASQTPETERQQFQEMLKGFMSMALPFLLLIFLTFLWGVFYFPAACAVAGYTRSFRATINPLVGLDTIKRLGFDYVKILLMGFIIGVWAAVIGGILSIVFVSFDMPGVGNPPATIIGSLFTFYFSVVFSCILGYAMFKASDRLKLFKG